MTLSDRQSSFLLDVARLIFWCHSHGYKVTAGECYRTDYQQKEYRRQGKTTVSHSKHQDRLAIDLNLFVDGVSMWEMSEDMQRLQFKKIWTQWESLRAGNEAGGLWENFYDPCHFEAA